MENGLPSTTALVILAFQPLNPGFPVSDILAKRPCLVGILGVARFQVKGFHHNLSVLE
jgi:hypothetical protein